MWTYEDTEGRRWQVVLGRESWGALYALFVPQEGGEVRQAALAADSYGSAQEEVEGQGADGLDRLFERSRPKTE